MFIHIMLFRVYEELSSIFTQYANIPSKPRGRFHTRSLADRNLIELSQWHENDNSCDNNETYKNYVRA